MLFAKRRQLALIKTAVAASGSALLISANALASSGSTLAEPVYVRFAQVTDDAYVRSGTYANTNYGDSSILRIKNYHSDFDRHALVRFDSVDLSGSSVIVLRAPYSGASPEENRDTKITQVDPNWNEDTVTYNTMPADLSTISEQSQFASAETLFIQDMSQALQGHSGELAFRFDMIDYVSGDIIEIHSKESGLGAVDLAYSYGDAQYSFDENTTLNFTLSAIDTDGTEISNYAIGNSASHGSVTVDPTTGAVEYVPTTDYVGADTFTVVATGANGVTVSKTVSLTINNINVAPTISGSPETTIAQDSAYRFTPTASDADFDVGDTLTFSVSGNPAWLSIHPTTGELSGTPSNGDVGTSSGIVVSVSDGIATISLPAFDLTVTNVNDAPSISGTPITSVAEDSAYSFTPTADDIDTGDSISFSVSGNPAWLSIHPTTGELS
ncbi:MAG: DNRLRE domain-containing protein, partial [Gammaproteobacteria bacterium]|nr:DNRLRE domain-containing protein [Gammaproteobacteria bacterium]